MRRLDTNFVRRVRARVNDLREDPYRNAVKLKSQPGFRQRVGDYRVVYEIDDAERMVLITSVEHRREAYR
jgi:mRNA interferase RelE/StbE